MAAPAAAAGPDLTAFLRRLSLFGGLADEELLQLVGRSRLISVPRGTLLMREGAPGDGLYVVVSGEIEVIRGSGGHEVILAVYGPGAFVGEMSLVGDGPRSASARSSQPSEILVVEPTAFRELLAQQPGASLTIMRTMLARLRNTEASLQQNARLASLGTLAAGLAHELNNPAAAIQRSAEHLGRALDALDACVRRAGAVGLTLDAPYAPGGTHRAASSDEEEEEIEIWLEDAETPDAARLAGSLAQCGWSVAELRAAVDRHPRPHRAVVLQAIAARCEARASLDGIARASTVLTDVVRAVKSYAHLGEAPRQRVDLRESIETTLIILGSRLRDGIEVETRVETGLPRIEAFGSELNQLWTNLVDNAVDAMDGSGTLRIVAARDGDEAVVVRVVDSGTGIPPEHLDRIFDPFFTTKPPGSGTGLGLHLAYQIVEKHRGSIHVESRPGRTEFRVTLPIGARGPDDVRNGLAPG
jgi:signal transduction histidine kinase